MIVVDCVRIRHPIHHDHENVHRWIVPLWGSWNSDGTSLPFRTARGPRWKIGLALGAHEGPRWLIAVVLGGSWNSDGPSLSLKEQRWPIAVLMGVR
jgi:hypothetical protein